MVCPSRSIRGRVNVVIAMPRRRPASIKGATVEIGVQTISIRYHRRSAATEGHVCDVEAAFGLSISPTKAVRCRALRAE